MDGCVPCCDWLLIPLRLLLAFHLLLPQHNIVCTQRRRPWLGTPPRRKLASPICRLCEQTTLHTIQLLLAGASCRTQKPRTIKLLLVARYLFRALPREDNAVLSACHFRPALRPTLHRERNANVCCFECAVRNHCQPSSAPLNA